MSHMCSQNDGVSICRMQVYRKLAKTHSKISKLDFGSNVTLNCRCYVGLHTGLSTEKAWTVFQNPLSSTVRQSPAKADTGFSDGQWLDYWCQLALIDYVVH